MAKIATLKDVAKLAGVSQGTVSRILNRDSSLNVPPSTKERVIRAAEKLNYKSLAQRYQTESFTEPHSTETVKEYRIGIAQMFEAEQLSEDVYYLIMKNLLEEECFSKKWSTVTLFRNGEGKFIKNDNQPLDGIIAIGRFTPSEISDFHELSDNIVFMDSSPDDMKYYSIVSNYHMAVRLTIEYYKKAGYSKITYVGAVNTFNGQKKLTMDPRFYYFKNTVNHKGILDCDSLIDCEMNSKSSYDAMSSYIREHNKPPKALFIASDTMASGVLKAIHESGFSVPEDVSIITYNNTTLSENSNPPLNSIEVYMKEHVHAAIMCMMELWNGNRIPKRIMITCSLIDRGSVK